ncbi:MAG: Ppx/GppA phosphatase family-domain-containing protein [Piptocephalis tieghemiana]|nr:MAG: Ppx/GppA phosphatase family-domain-containing protein [Piptocephalis tieghemiana]
MPPSTLPFAVVDVGSNGIRLTIFSSRERHLPILYRERAGISLYKERVSSLSRSTSFSSRENQEISCPQSITQSSEHPPLPSLPKETLNRVKATFTRFKRLTTEAGVEETLVVGTETVRLLGNEDDLERVIHQASGWSLQPLSTLDEARYGALGILATTGTRSGIIIDMGGGSVQCSHLNLAPQSQSSDPAEKKVQVGWPVRSLPYGAAAVMSRLEEAREEAKGKGKSKSSRGILSGLKGRWRNSHGSKSSPPPPPPPPPPSSSSNEGDEPHEEDVGLTIERAVRSSLLELMDAWGMVEAMSPTSITTTTTISGSAEEGGGVPHSQGNGQRGEVRAVEREVKEEGQEEGEKEEGESKTSKPTSPIPEQCYLTGGGGRALGYLIMHVTKAPLRLIEGWSLPIHTALEYMEGWEKDVKKGYPLRGLPHVSRILGVSKRRMTQLPAILLVLGQILRVLQDRGVREVLWSMGGMREGLAYGKFLSVEERQFHSPTLSAIYAWLRLQGPPTTLTPVEARTLVRSIQTDLHLPLNHQPPFRSSSYPSSSSSSRNNKTLLPAVEEQPTAHVMEMAVHLAPHLGSSLPPDNDEARARYAATFFLANGQGASWPGLQHRERVSLSIILSSRWSKHGGDFPIDEGTLTLLNPMEQGRCQGMGRILSLILSACPITFDSLLNGRIRLSWEDQGEGRSGEKEEGSRRKRRVLLSSIEGEEAPKQSISIPW